MKENNINGFNVVIDISYVAHKSYFIAKKVNKSVSDDLLLDILKRDLINIYNRLNIQKIYLAFDSYSALYWRKNIDAMYKANRINKQQDYCTAIDQLYKELLIDNRFISIKIDEAEADDIIALVIDAYWDTNNLIISNDSDLRQLLDKNVMIYNSNSTYPIVFCHELYNYKDFPYLKLYPKCKLKKVNPVFELMLKILNGDSTDNIKPLVSISKKKAIEFYNSFLKKQLDCNLYNYDFLSIKLQEFLKKEIEITEDNLKKQLSLVVLDKSFFPEKIVNQFKKFIE